MQKRAFIILMIIIVIGFIAIVSYQHSKSQKFSGNTPQVTNNIASGPSLSGSDMIWDTYTNDALGISYSYPRYQSIYTSTTSFQTTINLPSGSVIYGIATTRDYSSGKDNFGAGTEGFTIKDGKYYTIYSGNAVDTPFAPDEIWKLNDGSSVAILYGKNYDPSADYPTNAAEAEVNIPDKNFTGIGFTLLNMDNAGSHPASLEDLATFKKIVTSIKFIR